MTREEQLIEALNDLKDRIRNKRHEVNEFIEFLSDLEDEIEVAVGEEKRSHDSE